MGGCQGIACETVRETERMAACAPVAALDDRAEQVVEVVQVAEGSGRSQND